MWKTVKEYNNNNNNNNNNTWRLEEICCHSDSNEKPSANAGLKTSQISKIIIIISGSSRYERANKSWPDQVITEQQKGVIGTKSIYFYTTKNGNVNVHLTIQ